MQTHITDQKVQLKTAPAASPGRSPAQDSLRLPQIQLDHVCAAVVCVALQRTQLLSQRRHRRVHLHHLGSCTGKGTEGGSGCQSVCSALSCSRSAATAAFTSITSAAANGGHNVRRFDGEGNKQHVQLYFPPCLDASQGFVRGCQLGFGSAPRGILRREAYMSFPAASTPTRLAGGDGGRCHGRQVILLPNLYENLLRIAVFETRQKELVDLGSATPVVSWAAGRPPPKPPLPTPLHRCVTRNH